MNKLTTIVIPLVTVVAIAIVWRFPRTTRVESVVAPSPNAVASSPKDDTRVNPYGPTRAAARQPSPTCLACQKRECWNLIDGCKTLEGNAAAGPSSGTPRRVLCEAMLECARQTGCDSTVSIACYCGSVDLGSCLAGKGAGVCRQAIEAAAETVEPQAVFQHLKTKDYASGVVEPLLTCETRGCKEDCVPYYR